MQGGSGRAGPQLKPGPENFFPVRPKGPPAPALGIVRPRRIVVPAPPAIMKLLTHLLASSLTVLLALPVASQDAEAGLLERAESFAELFCARLDDPEVPYADLQAYYTDRMKAALGEARFEAAVGPMRQPGDADFLLATRTGARFVFRIEQEGAPWILDVGFDDRLLVNSLYVRAAPPRMSRTELLRQLEELPGDWGLASLLLDSRGQPIEYVELGETRPFALGSTFKIWVLAELAREITAGKRSWDDEMTIRDEWKSLPSGTMQTLAPGTKVTLHEMASKMIAISDNTATDHLIHLLGRGRIEDHLAEYGSTDVEINRPLLTTRDLFLFKSLRIEQRGLVFEDGKLGAVAETWAAGSEDEQAQWLEDLEAVGAELSNDAFQKTAMAYGIQTGFTPSHIAIEWFAKPRDTVELLRRAFTGELVDEATSEAFLEIYGHGQPMCQSPGIRRQGYKGGSESHVFHLSAGVEMNDGRIALLCLARSGFGTLAAAQVPTESVQLFQAWLAELVEVERPVEPKAPYRIDLRVSPLAELWFDLRSRAEDTRGQVDDSAPEASAVRAMHELGRTLGSALAFGYVESLLEEATTGEELVELCETLPERETILGRRGPREVELRRAATETALALAEVEAAWRETTWPARRNRLEHARLRLAAWLASPRGREALTHFHGTLDFATRGTTVPLYLTTEAGWPGGVTHYSVNGGGVCFVSLEDRSDSTVLETCLHESLHGLDVRDEGSANLLARLDNMLTSKGLDEVSKRNWVHTLFFVHAADTIRTFFDAEHVPYGEGGYYERLGEIAEVEVGLWEDLRAGNVSKEEVLQAIVEAAAE